MKFKLEFLWESNDSSALANIPIGVLARVSLFALVSDLDRALD